MPASKKPRKKHHHKVTWASAEKHCSFLIRGEDWTPDMLNDFAQDFLFPPGRDLLEQRGGSLHEKAFWENQGSARHGVGAWESSHRAG